MYSVQSAKEKAHYLGGAREEWFIILAISDAKIRHPNGARIFSDN
jgi:hypothetical protein